MKGMGRRSTGPEGTLSTFPEPGTEFLEGKSERVG